MNQIFFYMRIVMHLLHADMLNFKKEFFNKCIDLIIWVGCTVGITGYLIATEFSTTGNIGAFFLASSVASAGLFETYSRVFMLVNDFENEQTVYYYLSLPIPSWLYVIKNMIYYSIHAIVMGLPILPIGKLILWNSFDLSIICWWQLIIIYILTSMLYATLALILASFAPGIRSMDHLWMRIIFPLWFLGGYNNSWQTTYNLSPYLGYASLLNPITYIMEGCRTAILGTTGPITFAHSVGATMIFIILLTSLSIITLKKRLDWV